jgi:hypothetical protein
MKRYIKLTLSLFLFGFVYQSTGQVTCDSVAKITSQLLKSKPGDNRLFISDGQVYRAFLDEDQSAEFETTLYGGSVYRIAATAGSGENFVIFELYDQYRNLIFSNYNHKNADYWDFKVNSTLNCTVEVRLDLQIKSSGCAVMLIGFEKKK